MEGRSRNIRSSLKIYSKASSYNSFLAQLVYYLSEGYKAHLESFWGQLISAEIILGAKKLPIRILAEL